VANLPAKPAEQREDFKALTDLVQRAQDGDDAAMPALRKYFQVPSCVDMLGGALAQQIEHSLIEKASGENVLCKEVLTRKTEIMRAELAGPNPTPLERLLVDRIVTCWLHLHLTELRLVQSTGSSIAQADYSQRAIDRCQKRYLAAIKALATIRRLALPVLQLNIREKQVNNVARVA